MKVAIIIALFVSVISCTDREEKVIDLSEQIPKSTRDYDTPDTIPSDRMDLQELDEFRQWNPAITAFNDQEKRSFMERFRPDRSENKMWYLDSGDSVQYNRIVFKDSLKTKSAFYNWLDHESISYFGAEEKIQKEAMAILYADTVIITLSGAVDLNYWEDFFIEKEWLQEGDYWITQRKYGKARWRVFTNDKLQELKEE